MDILNYFVNHYIDEYPVWVENALGLEPKPVNDILLLIDLCLKMLLIVLLIATFYWGTRFLRFMWILYKQKILEMEEVNQFYLQDLREFRRPVQVDFGGAGDYVADHPHND